MERLLRVDPAERLSAEEVLAHPWSRAEDDEVREARAGGVGRRSRNFKLSRRTWKHHDEYRLGHDYWHDVLATRAHKSRLKGCQQEGGEHMAHLNNCISGGVIRA